MSSFPYPEGDGTFLYSSIRTSWFNPANPYQFYRYMLLEVVVNHSARDEGWEAGATGHRSWDLEPKIARAEEQWLHHYFGRNTHARYRYMWVYYGKPQPSIDQHAHGFHRLSAPLTYDNVHVTSKQTHVYLVPVPLPLDPDDWFWVDLTFPVRALYIPERHIARPDCKDRCAYYCLQVRQRDITIPHWLGPSGIQSRPLRLPRDDRLGWGYRAPRVSVGFDIRAITARLTVPNWMVRDEYLNVYDHCLVWTENSGRYPPYYQQLAVDMDMVTCGFSLAHVLSVTSGVPLAFDGTKDDWIVDVAKGLVVVAAGMIPVVGPLVALATQVLLDVLSDPKKFIDSQQGLLANIPNGVAAVLESCKLMRRYVKPGTLRQYARHIQAVTTVAKSVNLAPGIHALSQPATDQTHSAHEAQSQEEDPNLQAVMSASLLDTYYVNWEGLRLDSLDPEIWEQCRQLGLSMLPSIEPSHDLRAWCLEGE